MTVTVDQRRAGRRRGGLETGLAVLLDELRLFVGRLENAGLACDPPLSAAELVTATRVRSDPTVLAKLAGLRRSLAAAASVVAPQFGPMAVVGGLESGSGSMVGCTGRGGSPAGLAAMSQRRGWISCCSACRAPGR